jgi:hypothetical protein
MCSTRSTWLRVRAISAELLPIMAGQRDGHCHTATSPEVGSLVLRWQARYQRAVRRDGRGRICFRPPGALRRFWSCEAPVSPVRCWRMRSEPCGGGADVAGESRRALEKSSLDGCFNGNEEI